jgi:hypothetical protein
MSETMAERAVVIGAGMGGLGAAKVIAPYFERVVVLDRDALPEAPAPRIGTPQARHVHALLASGERALEELFPGIRSDFRKAGAVIIGGRGPGGGLYITFGGGGGGGGPPGGCHQGGICLKPNPPANW